MRKQMILAAIILLAAVFLRFAFLSRADLLGDEPLYAVRSFGWIDILYGSDQKTPNLWFKEAPAWTKISFHDHPPLTFAINHLFVKLTGDSLFSARLPAATFGVFSVLLMFLLCKKLFDEQTAMLTATLTAVSAAVIFYSRVSLMESVTLFFILLAFYIFTLSLDNPKYLPLFGIALGASFLAKYVAFAVVPLYLLFIIIYRRNYFKNYRLYLAALLLLAIFSPVIYYNCKMYQATGHFDLQFSFLLNQNTPEWPNPLGKMLRGQTMERLIGITKLVNILSPLSFAAALSGIFYLLFRWKTMSLGYKLSLGAFLSFLLFTVLSGADRRFMYYAIPFVLPMISGFIFSLPLKTMARKAVVAVLVAYEFLFAVNTNILGAVDKPLFKAPWAFAQDLQTLDRGIERLNQFFLNEFKGKYSAIKPLFRNQNFDKVIDKYYTPAPENVSSTKTLIIMDNRADIRVYNWILARYSLYHGWPFALSTMLGSPIDKKITDDITAYFTQTTDQAARSRQGFTNVNFIADRLKQKKIQPTIIIKNRHEEEVYKIYKISLSKLAELAVKEPPHAKTKAKKQ